MPQAQEVIVEIMEEAKSYNRIYIASIHPGNYNSITYNRFNLFKCEKMIDYLT
jgi:hypothetical protein